MCKSHYECLTNRDIYPALEEFSKWLGPEAQGDFLVDIYHLHIAVEKLKSLGLIDTEIINRVDLPLAE